MAVLKHLPTGKRNWCGEMNDSPKPKQYPLHIHISTLFLALILIVGGLLMSIGYAASRDLINSMADDLAERISRETTGELQKILRPVDTVLNVLALDKLAHAQNLQERMERLVLIRNLLDRNSVLASVYVGYANGDFFMARHVQSESERLRLKAPVNTAYVVQSIEQGVAANGLYLYLDPQLRVLDSVAKPDYPKSYDPRQRGWYQKASDVEHTVLTSPYLFFSDQQVGITMALSAKRTGVVMGADIQLQTINTSLGKQKISPGSQLALVNDGGTMFAHEDTASLVHISKDDDSAHLATLDTFGVPVLKQIFHEIDLQQLPSSGWLRRTLDTASETWQVAVNKLNVEGAEGLLLVIAVPQHELLAGAYAQIRIAAIVTLLIFLLSIPITWWMAGSISQPLIKLTKETDAIRQFEFERPLNVQSRILEVNRLAGTIAKMKHTIQQFLALSEAISAEKNFDHLLPKLLGETVAVTEASSGILYLNDLAGLVPICALGREGQSLNRQELDQLCRLPVLDHAAVTKAATSESARSLLEQALLEGQVLAAPLSKADVVALGLTDAVYNGGAMHMLAVPLLNRRLELTGAMVLISSKPSEKDLISFVDAFSGTAAVSLEAQAMIKEQKDLFESFIRLVAAAIDAKSPYTGGHCARVPELVKMLARAACDANDGPYKTFGMSEDEWETLRIAAWLHDCGKVTTPEYVVDKATKLETIYNRIHEVRTRFEVLKRDAQIRHLERVLAGANTSDSQHQLESEWHEIDSDYAMVAHCNEGSEMLSEDKLQALGRIAQRTWLRSIDNRLGLSQEEKDRLSTGAPAMTPAMESVLTDRMEHRIERSAHDTIPTDNSWGFRMKVPELLYNHGELYNLSIRKGTLTEEERYKINDHIVQTEIMLSELPFPRRLQHVPSIAAAHHEKLDGSGYPKGLIASQLTPQARMLAIADIFEALTATDRPYKKGMKLSMAIQVMGKMRDEHHIDADLFALFLRSGAYRKYAEQHMKPEQVDEVDLAAVLA